MIKKISLLCFLGTLVLSFYFSLSFIPLSFDQKESFVLFEVKKNQSFSKVISELKKKALIRSPMRLKIIAYLLSLTQKVKIGEYKIYHSMSPYLVLKHLCFGKQILHPFLVQEGMNIYEIQKALEKNKIDAAKDFLFWVKNPDFIRTVLKSPLSSLEGYLFPETYYLSKNTSAKKLIRMMLRNFFENWNEILNQKNLISLPIHKAVILASMIEKETGYKAERRLISSVFHNRLRIKMKLQSDPTILYGILDQTKIYKKNITRKDIRRPTPYNTYTVPSLPYGPIGNPGKKALSASLNPASSPYFYFVSRNDGTHVFTKTYKEHLKQVRKFQLNPKMRKGKSWRNLKKD